MLRRVRKQSFGKEILRYLVPPPEGESIDSKTRLVLWKDDYLSSIQFPFHNTASTETEHRAITFSQKYL